jgi:hypothetical protein
LTVVKEISTLVLNAKGFTFVSLPDQSSEAQSVRCSIDEASDRHGPTSGRVYVKNQAGIIKHKEGLCPNVT